MDPHRDPARPSRMRSIAVSVTALLLPLALVACSGGQGDDIASDPAPTTATAEPTPTAEPTVGTYPTFAPPDYTYTLSVSCFCPAAGVPIAVSVVGSEVVDAVYALDDTGRGGVKAGDPADQAFWLTINDVIDRANDLEAARVEVDWPAGQDYPNSVYVDGSEQVADDEIGYTVSDVEAG